MPVELLTLPVSLALAPNHIKPNQKCDDYVNLQPNLEEGTIDFAHLRLDHQNDEENNNGGSEENPQAQRLSESEQNSKSDLGSAYIHKEMDDKSKDNIHVFSGTYDMP